MHDVPLDEHTALLSAPRPRRRPCRADMLRQAVGCGCCLGLVVGTLLLIGFGQGDHLAQPLSMDLFRLTGCMAPEFQAAGFTDLGDGQHYFFWLGESRRDPARDPLVVWLSGGPGCSSTFALLRENGPCRVLAGDGGGGVRVVPNPHSWTRVANVLWLDQPVGVGFSYADGPGAAATESEPETEARVAENFSVFLERWLADHPRFRGRRLFVFGESYAGHYVPAIASRLLARGVRLSGLGVGNGWISPVVQYASAPRMAMNNSYGVQVVTPAAYAAMLEAVAPCTDGVRECLRNASSCAGALSFCSARLDDPVVSSGRNPYDIRQWCRFQPRNLCGALDSWQDIGARELQDFMDARATRLALGLLPPGPRMRQAPWHLCSAAVGRRFGALDRLESFDRGLAAALSAGIPVLVYAGDADFMCNWMGLRDWSLRFEWPGQQAFVHAAVDVPWFLPAAGNDTRPRAAGTRRTEGLFSFVRVFGAGHMVPLDQPEAALHLFEQFTAGHPSSG